MPPMRARRPRRRARPHLQRRRPGRAGRHRWPLDISPPRDAPERPPWAPTARAPRRRTRRRTCVRNILSATDAPPRTANGTPDTPGLLVGRCRRDGRPLTCSVRTSSSNLALRACLAECACKQKFSEIMRGIACKFFFKRCTRVQWFYFCPAYSWIS